MGREVRGCVCVFGGFVGVRGLMVGWDVVLLFAAGGESGQGG